MNNIKEKAIFYWQDKLSKFFPTSEPSSVELDMYEAGYKQALLDSVEILKRERGIWADVVATPKILALGSIHKDE